MSAAGQPSHSCTRCGAPLIPDARVCGECGELVRPTGVPSAQSRATDPQYATTDLKVGDVVEGNWQLEEIVGRGGMGAVFSATDLKLGRKVAVKALSASLAGEEFVNRFEREARVLGILDHPNIVTLHWVGRHKGVPFIVMKYLEGDALRRWVEGKGGRVNLDGMLQIARPVCSALSYVHSKGVIHRDLKPSNIMVAPNGHVTVFDLGIARPHDSQLTKTGIIFGTPGYMSPELIVGEKNLDGRLDLYALAVILFEILTGQSPFSDRNEDSLLRAHLMQPRPDASQIRPDLPKQLGQVLIKAMALDPKDRYPDCDEFLAALEAACGKREFHEAATIMRVPMSRDALSKAPLPPGMSRPGVAQTVDPEVTRDESRNAPTQAAPSRPSNSIATVDESLGRAGRASRGGGVPAPRSSSRDDVPRTEAPAPRASSAATPQRAPSSANVPQPRSASSAQVQQQRSASSAQVQQQRSASSAQVRQQVDPDLVTEDAPPRPSAQKPRRTGAVAVAPAELEAATLSEDEDSGPRWYQRRSAQVGIGVALLALIALVAFGFWHDAESSGAKGPVPLPKIVGIEVPPAPSGSTGQGAGSVSQQDRESTHPVTPDGKTLDVNRIRKVTPSVKKTASKFAGAPKDYGELQIDVTVNGEPVNAQVAMDGEAVGEAPIYIPAKVGKHTLRVTHKEFPVSNFTANVTGATSLHIEVELQPLNDNVVEASDDPAAP